MIRNLLYLLSFSLLLLPHGTQAQKRELQPVSKTNKIAFIDHSRLRSEFKALTSIREAAKQKWQDAKKELDNSLLAQDKLVNQQLRQDSLTKGRKKDLIVQESDRKKQLLQSNYQLNQKKLFDDRTVQLQEYEKKIAAAIGKVVTEGGFTEIKPLPAEKDNRNGGTDITDLILQKLN